MRRDRLIAARRLAGKTQEEIAELVGVDRTTVGTWERGERTPQPYQRPPYAEAMRITLSELDSMLTSIPNERPVLGLTQYLGMEQSASEILDHEPHVVHGLLQTPAYAEAIGRSVGVNPPSDDYAKRNVEQRSWRQARLLRGDLTLHVVQPEIALDCSWAAGPTWPTRWTTWWRCASARTSRCRSSRSAEASTKPCAWAASRS